MLNHYLRALVLHYTARWHLRRFERHERLMLRHGDAIKALLPEGERLRRELHVDA